MLRKLREFEESAAQAGRSEVGWFWLPLYRIGFAALCMQMVQKRCSTCAVTTGVLCAWCINSCNKEAVADAAALQPPEVSYSLSDANRNVGIELNTPVPTPVQRKARSALVATIRSTAKGQPVYAFELQPRNPSQAGLPYIVYLHGNATDVGELMPFLWQLAGSVSAKILAVEYQGFGLSGGSPSISALRTDAEAAICWLHENRNVGRSSIVLYGQSIGSFPAMSLATEFVGLRGLVLHSPMLSALSVLSAAHDDPCAPIRALSALDVLSNDHLAPSVKCPVFLLHGSDDREVPVSHGKRIASLLPAHFLQRQWFPAGCSHNDIAETYFAILISYLWEFVHGVPQYDFSKFSIFFDLCHLNDQLLLSNMCLFAICREALLTSPFIRSITKQWQLMGQE